MDITPTFTWTPRGRQRVAWAILGTLKHNEQNGLYPGKIRQLASLASLPNHTSLGRYTRASTSHPNNAGGKVLRSIAPYVYRVKAFYVKENDQRELTAIDFVSVPDIEDLGDAAAWELAETYDYAGLATLGTQAADDMEVVDAPLVQCPPEALWLYELMRSLGSSSLGAVARVADLSPNTMVRLLDPQKADNERSLASFSSLSEVLKDFLVTQTPLKMKIWRPEDMALAKGINPDVSGLTADRLRAIIFRGEKASPAELSRLVACMSAHGVSWAHGDLEILNERQPVLA